MRSDTDKRLMSSMTVYPVEHRTPLSQMTVVCHGEYYVGEYKYDLVLLKEKSEDEGIVSTCYYVIDMRPHGKCHTAIPLTVTSLEVAVIVRAYDELSGRIYCTYDDGPEEECMTVYRDDDVVHKEARALYDELWREVSDEPTVYTGRQGLSDMTTLTMSDPYDVGSVMRDFPDEATLGYYRTVLGRTMKGEHLFKVMLRALDSSGEVSERDLRRVGLSETDIESIGEALRDYYREHKDYAAEHVRDVCRYDDKAQYYVDEDEVTDDEYEEEDE